MVFFSSPKSNIINTLKHAVNFVHCLFTFVLLWSYEWKQQFFHLNFLVCCCIGVILLWCLLFNNKNVVKVKCITHFSCILNIACLKVVLERKNKKHFSCSVNKQEKCFLLCFNFVCLFFSFTFFVVFLFLPIILRMKGSLCCKD